MMLVSGNLGILVVCLEVGLLFESVVGMFYGLVDLNFGVVQMFGDVLGLIEELIICVVQEMYYMFGVCVVGFLFK